MPTRPPAFAAADEEAIVLALFDLVNQLGKLGERLAGRVGLTAQQWLVLLQVAGDPNFQVTPGAPRAAADGVVASDIALARGVSRANVSALVSGLLGRGFVRQEEQAGDRRVKRLKLTATGRSALAELEGARRRANRKLLRDLDAQGRRALLTALKGCLHQVWLAEAAGGLAPVKRAGRRGRNSISGG